MPFVAECILCAQKLRLPDRATGASVQCPRCKSYFTAVPDDDRLPATQTSATAATSIETSTPPAPVATALTLPRPSAVPEAPTSVAVPVRSRWRLPLLDPVGVASLLLAGGALLSASFAWLLSALTWFVLPLLLVGALVGLGGIIRGLKAPKPRYALTGLGLGLNLVITIIAVGFPSLLGPTYALSRQAGAREAAQPRPVPLSHLRPDAAPEDPEWPDAGKFSMQVRKTRIQVMSATIRPLEIGGSKKLTKESYLIIRVRAHRPAGGTEFTAETWGAPGKGKERPKATLTDESGRVYNQPTIGQDAGELSQKSNMFPIGITDEIYVFDAPPTATGTLRLQIPAESWGGTGLIRFAIPTSMFRSEPGQPVKKG
jgi:hypothetical protein